MAHNILLYYYYSIMLVFSVSSFLATVTTAVGILVLFTAHLVALGRNECCEVTTTLSFFLSVPRFNAYLEKNAVSEMLV